MSWTKIFGNLQKPFKQDEQGRLEISGSFEGNFDGLSDMPKALSHTKIIKFEHEHNGTNANEIFEQSSDPLAIWSLSFSTDDPGAYLQIYPFDANGEAQSYIQLADGANLNHRNPSANWLNTLTGQQAPGIITPGESGLFKLVRFDNENDIYQVELINTPIYCPNGLRLRSVGSSSGSSKVAVSAKIEYYRAVDG